VSYPTRTAAGVRTVVVGNEDLDPAGLGDGLQLVDRDLAGLLDLLLLVDRLLAGPLDLVLLVDRDVDRNSLGLVARDDLTGSLLLDGVDLDGLDLGDRFRRPSDEHVTGPGLVDLLVPRGRELLDAHPAVGVELDLGVEAVVADERGRLGLERGEVDLVEVDALRLGVGAGEVRVAGVGARFVPESVHRGDRVEVAPVREVEFDPVVAVDQSARCAGDAERMAVLEEDERAEGLVLPDERGDDPQRVAGAAGRFEDVVLVRPALGIHRDGRVALQGSKPLEVLAAAVDTDVGGPDLAVQHAARVLQPGLVGVRFPGDGAAVVAVHRVAKLDVSVFVGVRARVDHVHGQLEPGVGLVVGAGLVLEDRLVARLAHDPAGRERGQRSDGSGDDEDDGYQNMAARGRLASLSHGVTSLYCDSLAPVGAPRTGASGAVEHRAPAHNPQVARAGSLLCPTGYLVTPRGREASAATSW